VAQQTTPHALGRLSGLTGGRAGSLAIKWVASSHYLEEPTQRAQAMQAVLDDVRDGVLKVRVAARIPLAQAARAHTLLAGRNVAGKLLLEA
jgi:NADPH2:quinone reductase